MSQQYRRALFIGAAVAVPLFLVACGSPGSPQPPINATEDSLTVWIALLKGFSGDVIYVGSDDAHAYFRIGSFSGPDYKVPACAVRLPEKFPVGHGKPYVVRLHVEHGEDRVVSDCAKNEVQPIGQLDRK